MAVPKRLVGPMSRPFVAAALLLSIACGALAAETPAAGVSASPRAAEALAFTLGEIPPLTVAGCSHLAAAKNGVKFDVYFAPGRKESAAIYAINTGRKQLVLTPEKHQAILADLVRRRFTVIVADFRDKRLSGLELENYVVQLTADAREAADWISPRLRKPAAATSRTETYADDYFTLMPGFTVERDVTWFRYGDIPAPFRREIARQLGKPFDEAVADKVNTYDIVYPAYGPTVGVLTNYASDEKGREPYYPLEKRYLVQSFALKNLAIVHQQYFNDPIGGYPQGYGYYGDQFAACFIRHLKGNAARYHFDPQKICCFGHSKGSEVPGMLINKLRGTPRFAREKVDFKKLDLDDADKIIPSPYAHLSTEIACAILGSGVANNQLRSPKVMPWDDEPAKNISPFLLFADHVELIRERTREVVALAKQHGVDVETTELNGHTWPFGPAYDQASKFADRILRPEY